MFIAREKPSSSPKMKQEFLTTLPSHIIIDILSRLPIPTILRCRCVCKSWLNLLQDREFLNYHLSKSIPSLAFLKKGYYEASKLYKIFNFNDDDHDLQQHELHYGLVTSFEPPFPGSLIASANGLLLFSDYCNGLFVCNPITREYMELHTNHHQKVTFGFGASRVKGQHKVVTVFHEETSHKLQRTVCQVYILGTGTWRSISPPVAPFSYNGVFSNGNLHWLMFDSRGSGTGISCLDLETEHFSILSLPPPLPDHEERRVCNVFALGNLLGVCDALFDEIDDEIYIWLMKEYGVENSWTKEYVIKKPILCASYDPGHTVHPIKVFKDGDILMQWCDFYLFYFSSKTKTSAVIDMFEAHRFGHIESILHTSSFISLKSFPMEKVFSF